MGTNKQWRCKLLWIFVRNRKIYVNYSNNKMLFCSSFSPFLLLKSLDKNLGWCYLWEMSYSVAFGKWHRRDDLPVIQHLWMTGSQQVPETLLRKWAGRRMQVSFPGVRSSASVAGNFRLTLKLEAESPLGCIINKVMCEGTGEKRQCSWRRLSFS